MNGKKKIIELPDEECRDISDYCLADSDLEFVPYDDLEASWEQPPIAVRVVYY